MLGKSILSKSSQRLKRIPAVRRLVGSHVGRRAAEMVLGLHGVRYLMRSVITSQRSREESLADAVLVSSNGAGLGHLTRLEAINKSLSKPTVIYTLSKGYRKLGKRADELVYFPSSASLQLSSRKWNSLLFSHFGAFVATYNPKVIVFDGTYLYSGVVDASKALGIPLVWIRRGMWKEDVERNSIQFHSLEKFCDFVIVPGEYANESRALDSSVVKHVAPVVVHQQEELLGRITAREHFNFLPEKKYVLVQLGAGNINDIDDWISTACEEILALGSEWTPVLLSNPLSSDRQLPPGAVVVQGFPISLYLKAFDFAVVAAGYNSVQESIASEVPIIAVPNLKTGTDDQHKRAVAIDKAGLGLAVNNLSELRESVKKMASPEFRDEIQAAQRSEALPFGAQQIAQILEERYLR